MPSRDTMFAIRDLATTVKLRSLHRSELIEIAPWSTHVFPS
jgi:hypothetical protein